jgi:hypothetical protein
MNAAAKRVLRSLVPIICPPEAVPYADDIVDHMCLTIAASPSMLTHALTAGLLTYDLGAVPGYRKRAHKLTGDDAEAYFASWEHGITPMQVQFARGMNQLMSLSCYEQPAMMKASSYHPGPWIEEVTKKRLTVFADDIKKQDAQILAPDPLRTPVSRKTKKEVA